MEQSGRWFVLAFLGSLIGITLTACAVKTPPPEREFVPEVTATPEVEPRGSVFVYGQGRSSGSARITLQLNGEPLLLPAGYARVVGVVNGDSPVACLEIGGRGLALAPGDRVDDYRVVAVKERTVVLQKGK
jgi:hypothetical protein